jgi:hypothetical protein
VVVAIVAVVAGLAATGGVLYANNKAPFTDSGVQMCKTMAANQNANRGSSGTGFDRAAAEQARATFAGSRHSDLAATGVTLVDDVISLNASGATQDPSQLSGALFGAMSIIGDIKAARTTEWRCPRSLIDPSGGNSATHSSDEVSACKADAETVTIAADAYYARNGTYAADMATLVTAGFLHSVPTDVAYGQTPTTTQVTRTLDPSASGGCG